MNKLKKVVVGDIGGVLLAKSGVKGKEAAKFQEIVSHMTGVTLDHYENCAKKDPGVIVLALGENKANVVFECIQRLIVFVEVDRQRTSRDCTICRNA